MRTSLHSSRITIPHHSPRNKQIVRASLDFLPDSGSMCHVLPCVIFEDEHLLVVNKPPGLNTHAPAPHAGEGLYDWLRDREARWARLAIIHRLDKETSGVMVFSKTAEANRSLSEQFTKREVRKKYLLLTDRQPRQKHLTLR